MSYTDLSACRVSDYCSVNGSIWRYLLSVYGGGPTVIFNQVRNELPARLTARPPLTDCLTNTILYIKRYNKLSGFTELQINAYLLGSQGFGQ